MYFVQLRIARKAVSAGGTTTGGKRQFPCWWTRITSTVLYESADIIDSLFTTYAERLHHGPTGQARCRPLAGGLELLCVALAASKYVRPSRPKQLLELWSFGRARIHVWCVSA